MFVLRSLAALFCIFCTFPLHAEWQNGEFSEGLSSWTSSGDVGVVAGGANLGDRSAEGSQLLQLLSLRGPSVLSFEWNGILSPVVPQGRAPDTFFATLYFTDQRSSFSLNPGGFDTAQPLLDQDRGGVSLSSGTTEPGTLPGWTRFTLGLPGTHRFVAAVFELFGDNLIANDSLVQPDHMKLLTLNTTIFRIGFTNAYQTVVVDFEQFAGSAPMYRLEANPDPGNASGWSPVPGASIQRISDGVFRATAPSDPGRYLMYRIGAAGTFITSISISQTGEVLLGFSDYSHSLGQFAFEANPSLTNAAGWVPVIPLSVTAGGPGQFSALFPAGTPANLRVVIP